MIVTFRLAIVAAGAIAEIDFEHEAGLFQITQGVVDGGVADTGQADSRRRKDIARGWVVVPLLNHLKNGFSLGSQLRFFFGRLHSGFRLILNRRFVKQRGFQRW